MIPASGVEDSQRIDWELLWSPYDERTYQEVLAEIRHDDVVIDIGAGDFRLAKRIAAKAQTVYGVELQRDLFPEEAISNNLIPVNEDARAWPFPAHTTIGILLMRHCRNFSLYAEKLKHAGADRLLTNARWRMGVEVVDLRRERDHYSDIEMGWFACWCGSVGFKPGPPEDLTPAIDAYIHEVADCPMCNRQESDGWINQKQS
jgi:hypothetical protein